MAEIEDTPPATQPLPTLPHTSPLPAQAVPATLPDPADLRPGGPARRWTWLLGGITAGAGTAALVLGLVANLVTPTATASAGPATAGATNASAASAGSTAAASSGASSPAAALYTASAAGCALVRPETVARYAKGASCTEQKLAGTGTSSGSWNGQDSGLIMLQVVVTLTPNADSIYQATLSSARTMAATTDMKITDDRSVPGVGAKATLLYTVAWGYGRVELVVLQRNAVVTVNYQAATRSGYTLKDVPPSDAEAAATAAARDALGTLTTS